jgi:hypothetical protein
MRRGFTLVWSARQSHSLAGALSAAGPIAAIMTPMSARHRSRRGILSGSSVERGADLHSLVFFRSSSTAKSRTASQVFAPA